MATSHAEKFMMYKINYDSKPDWMVPQKRYSMNAITVVCGVSFATKLDSRANCTKMHFEVNPNHMMNHSVNASSATNVCINSCDLKANVQSAAKPNMLTCNSK